MTRTVVCRVVLSLALCMAYLTSANSLWSAPVTSLMGSYGILLNQWPSPNTGNNTTAALLGVFNFDGAGNVTATYTKVNPDYTVKTGKATGTYSGNPDGSNTVSLTFDGGSVWTAVVTVTDGGSGLQLVVTGGSPLNAGEVITGIGRIQSAQGTTPSGSYSFLLNSWPDANNRPAGFTGILNLGGGKINGSYAFANGRTTAFSGTLTGTYSTNPDGTGSMNINLDLGVSSTFAIVVTEGGSGILLLETDPGQVTTGAARM